MWKQEKQKPSSHLAVRCACILANYIFHYYWQIIILGYHTYVLVGCKVLDYGLDGPGVKRGGEFSSLRVQTGPGVHSAFQKMSQQPCVGLATYLFLVPWLYIHVSPFSYIPHEPSWPVTGYLYIYPYNYSKECMQQSLLLKWNVGQVAQAARRWAMGWMARVRSRVSERWIFFFTPSCPD